MLLSRAIRSSLVLGLLATSALFGVARGQEWTRFRGPNGSGQSEATTIPAVWTESDQLWKATLPGLGNASPVLWGDKIFLTSADAEQGTRFVLCLSATDGRSLWQRDFPSQKHAIHVQNTLASSTPTVDEARVYAAWSTPEEFTVVAHTHAGELAWRVNLGPFISQHGFGTSPILFGDLLIITNDQDADSFVVALDRKTGDIRWKVPRERLPEQNACYATPCLFTPKGKSPELIICSRASGVSGLDPLSGKTLWQSEVIERRPVASPIVVDDRILTNYGDGGGNNSVVAIKPYADGQTPKVTKLIDRTSAPYVPSLVARDNLVFLWGDRGVVCCIDATTGKIHWKERVGGNFYGSPIRVADCIYCIALDGEVVTLAASQEYKSLGRSPLGETARSTPAVAGGRMFLRTESHLIAVGQK